MERYFNLWRAGKRQNSSGCNRTDRRSTKACSKSKLPGESGNGRSSGSNWIGDTDILGSITNYIDAFITNNRGVTTNEVYNMRPMYQFVLTPANIRSIRQYNKNHGNDYNDFTLSCNDGLYCSSSFLADGQDNGYFGFTQDNPTGGSCFGAISTNWESCRYTNIGG